MTDFYPMHWLSWHMLDLLLRMALSIKWAVVHQWHGEGVCSIQSFRFQADGGSATFNMWLPRSVT